MNYLIIPKEVQENKAIGIASLQLAMKGMESQIRPNLVNLNGYIDSERLKNLIDRSSVSSNCSLLKVILESNDKIFKDLKARLELGLSSIPKLDFTNIQFGNIGSISSGGARMDTNWNDGLEVRERKINITLRLKDDIDDSRK